MNAQRMRAHARISLGSVRSTATARATAWLSRGCAKEELWEPNASMEGRVPRGSSMFSSAQEALRLRMERDAPDARDDASEPRCGSGLVASEGCRRWKVCGRAGESREPVPLPRGSGRWGAWGGSCWLAEEVVGMVEELGPRLAISECVVAERAAAEGMGWPMEEVALAVAGRPRGGTSCRGCPFRMGACRCARTVGAAAGCAGSIDGRACKVLAGSLVGRVRKTLGQRCPGCWGLPRHDGSPAEYAVGGPPEAIHLQSLLLTVCRAGARRSLTRSRERLATLGTPWLSDLGSGVGIGRWRWQTEMKRTDFDEELLLDVECHHAYPESAAWSPSRAAPAGGRRAWDVTALKRANYTGTVDLLTSKFLLWGEMNIDHSATGLVRGSI